MAQPLTPGGGELTNSSDKLLFNPSKVGEPKKSFFKRLFQKSSSKKPQGQRTIYLNLEPVRQILPGSPPTTHDAPLHPQQSFCSNHIKTSRYNLITFIPLNLFQQFHRVANIFFVFIIVLQAIPETSSSPIFIAAAPLISILTLQALKDGAEDWKRRQSDREINKARTMTLRYHRNPNVSEKKGLSAFFSGSKARKRGTSGSSGSVSGSIPRDLAPTPDNSIPRYAGKFRPDSGRASAMGAPNPQQYPSLSHGSLSHRFLANQRRTSQFTMQSIVTANRSWHVKNEWKSVTWDSLHVGDFVFLTKDEAVPADILILDTSNDSQQVYVETKNLDGETNLKVKNATSIPNHLQPRDVKDLRRFRALLVSEAPNFQLYSYSGTLQVMQSRLEGPTAFETDRRLAGGHGIHRAVSPLTPLANSPLFHGKGDSISKGSPLNAPSISGGSLNGASPAVTAKMLPNASDYKIVEEIPVNADNLLLRGSIIRNTDYVIGMIAYTGVDTKIVLNTGKTPAKRSAIERRMNLHVGLNFFVQLLISTTLVIGSTLILANTPRDEYFSESLYDLIMNSGNLVVIGIITFFAALVVFHNIIPISLYVAIEFVKTALALFVLADRELVDPKTDKPTRPKTLSIIDDLGQIEYIFSDKTGTLTENRMQFRQAWIGGTVYGKGMEDSSDWYGTYGRASTPNLSEDANAPFRDPKLDAVLNDMKNGSTGAIPQFDRLLNPTNSSEVSGLVKMFWVVLGVCHTVVATDVVEDEMGGEQNDVEDDEDGDPDHLQAYETQDNAISPHVDRQHMRIEYRSPSPDEEALVKAARDVGFVYKSKAGKTITLQILGTTHHFEILQTFEFNSARKRMSVVVQWIPPPKSGIAPVKLILAKGADDVMLARATGPQKNSLPAIEQVLGDFARGGLRTLVMGYRLMSDSEFERLQKDAVEANALLKGREEAVLALADSVEHDFTLVGASAIEDRLQEGVPASIATFLQAGIKVWVLTGDKVETAINIGYSSKLLTRDMELVEITYSEKERVRSSLQEGLQKVNRAAHSKVALVITGDALKVIMEDDLMKKLFLDFSTRCVSVVCSRVAALQKAQVVKLVRYELKAMCLAIGDGANDVSMIQQANVGIGISGLEGQQAALAADVSTGQFRFLTRLLLIHGQWSYIRISNLIFNFFYKNLIWVMATFWFQFYTQFSASVLSDPLYQSMYNLVLTVFPVIIIGIFDTDIPEEYAFMYPQTYKRGIKNRLYTNKIFWIYMIEGIYHSVVIFFISLLVSQDVQVDAQLPDDWKKFGTRMVIIAVVVANLSNTVNLRSFNKVSALLLVFCVLLPFIFTLVISMFSSMLSTYGITEVLLNEWHIYLQLLVIVPICLMPRILIRFYFRWFHPDEIQAIKEEYKLDRRRQRKLRKGISSKNHLHNTEAQLPYENIPIQPAAPQRITSI